MFLNTSYEVIVNGIEAAIVAQLLKFLGHLIKTRKVDFQVLATTGGMPSSHTAGVVSLSTTVGIICGFDSIEFAIAIGYALVVMYDAAGLRRSTGKIAACLNKIRDDFYANGQVPNERLKELLGHTPFEVFVGALLGAYMAFMNHFYLFQ
ncbi:MAG: divergent PAP2 family protein [Candidatus Gastranaerophilales bacterium]|nr:divergent PAP2 family protein [Candidatus Gastranaerophilales bacterium]